MEHVPDQRSGDDNEMSGQGDALVDTSLDFMQQFHTSQDTKHLDAAVDAASLAIEQTPDGHHEMPFRLFNLSAILDVRHKHVHKVQDLRDSNMWLEKAVGLLNETQYELYSWLLDLGISQGSLFEKSGLDSDMMSCILTFRRLLALRTHVPHIRSEACRRLSDRLAQRYENIGNDHDLDDAVTFARELLPGKSDPQAIFNPVDATYLIRHLGLRYQRFGKRSDLDEAIVLASQAVSTTAEDDARLPAYSTNLALLLEHRFSAGEDPKDLQRAITLSQSAVRSPSMSLEWRSKCASNLGTKLMTLFELTGHIETAREALEMGRLADGLWMQAFGTHNLKTCHNLGVNLARYYQYTGQSWSLQEGIDLLDQALKHCSDTSLYHSIVLDSLSGMLYMRYEQVGELEDLDRSILLSRAILCSTDQDHKDYFRMRLSLARGISKRFERLHVHKDFKESMEIAEHDLNLAKRHDGFSRWTAKIMVSLGHSLRLLYQNSGDVAPLMRAINLGEEAIELVGSHDLQVDWLTTLANNYGYLYEQSHKIQYLFRAISLSEKALQSGSFQTRSQAMLLNNVAYKYEVLYSENNNDKCLMRACNLFKRAWHSVDSIPFHLVMSASRCLRLMTRLGRHEETVEMAQDMLDFMSTFSISSLNYDDRQYVVSTFSGVATEACASFLELGQSELAVSFLERGRTMILNDLLQHQIDISELISQHPEIAKDYQALQDQIVNPVKDDGTDLTRRTVLEHRCFVVKELGRTIKKIQALDGWAEFLASPSIDTIKACARGGVVVIVNAARSRSDAILISSSQISVVRLPRMTAQDAEGWVKHKWDGNRQQVPTLNKLYREYLPWLWDVCVKPVTDRIPQIHTQCSQGLPRIWWIGIGVCSSMPFHAAGDHSAGSTQNTFSCGISSYIPSIRALAHSQKRLSESKRQDKSLLITTMSKTPGLEDLKRSLLEKDRIIDCTKNLLSSHTWKDQPSSEAVFQGLQEVTAVHFACHGITDKHNPSKSGLVLRAPAGEEPSAEVLTVHKLSSIRSRRAEIAYLSSCSTAENKLIRLSDEVIHVASAFQIAGFSHVIACLWSTYDDVCADVASNFYRSVFGDSMESIKDYNVAEALHKAVLIERDLRPRNPLSWAQFVHFGA